MRSYPDWGGPGGAVPDNGSARGGDGCAADRRRAGDSGQGADGERRRGRPRGAVPGNGMPRGVDGDTPARRAAGDRAYPAVRVDGDGADQAVPFQVRALPSPSTATQNGARPPAWPGGRGSHTHIQRPAACGRLQTGKRGGAGWLSAHWFVTGQTQTDSGAALVKMCFISDEREDPLPRPRRRIALMCRDIGEYRRSVQAWRAELERRPLYLGGVGIYLSGGSDPLTAPASSSVRGGGQPPRGHCGAPPRV